MADAPAPDPNACLWPRCGCRGECRRPLLDPPARAPSVASSAPSARPAPAPDDAAQPEWTKHERPMEQWDTDTVASMVNVFADEHPRPKVQRVMQEAARRLREHEAALAAARAREGEQPAGLDDDLAAAVRAVQERATEWMNRDGNDVQRRYAKGRADELWELALRLREHRAALRPAGDGSTEVGNA